MLLMTPFYEVFDIFLGFPDTEDNQFGSSFITARSSALLSVGLDESVNAMK